MAQEAAPSPFSDYKQSVRVASTVNIDLESAPPVIDGIAIGYGDKFLAKDQDDAKDNGIYVYRNNENTAVHATGGRGGQLTSGALVIVEEGDTNADKIFMLTTDGPITVSVTPLTFEEFAPAAAPVDISGKVDKAGDTMTGNLFMSNKRVEGIGFSSPLSVFLLTGQGNFSANMRAGGELQFNDSAIGPAETLRINSAGIAFSDANFPTNDATLSHGGNNIIAVGSGDKLQQNEAPTVGDDLVNKLYADSLSGFDPSADQVITGNWDFNKPIEMIETGSTPSIHFKEFISAGSALITGRLVGDTSYRVEVTAGGYIRFGPGTSGSDVLLFRTAANTLSLNTGQQFQIQQDPVAANDLARKSYVDSVGPTALIALQQSAPQATADATYTSITWDVEVADALGFHAPGSPTLVTVPVGRAGKYKVTASVKVDNPSAGNDHGLRVLVNGAPVFEREEFVGGGVFNSYTVSIANAVLDLSEGDDVEIAFYHNEGAPLNTVIDGTYVTMESVNELS